MRSKPGAMPPPVASASITVTLRRPSRCACAATSPARSGSSSIEITSPRSPIRAAIWPVLIPGPAQRSSTCSPCRGSRTSTTAAEPRLCGVSSPAATSGGHGLAGAAGDDDRLGSGERPARPRRRWPRPRPRRAASSARLAVAAQQVDPHPHLGRLVAGGEQRTGAVSAPSSSHHIRASQSGAEWATAAASGVESSSSSAAVSAARSRAARRSTALTRPEAWAAPAPLTSSTAWSTAAWSGVPSAKSSS